MVKRILRVVLGLVVGVFALYYGGVNALLATPLGPALLNGKPELVQFHYRRAWTLLPLQLEIEGFDLSMQDRLVQINISADHVRGRLALWKLLDQRLDARQIEAEGVGMRIRPRMDLADARDLEELPPIPGYETPVRDISPLEVQASEIRFITLALQDITIHHFRELWVDRVRYTGDAEVSGGMLFEPFRRLRLDDVHFVDAQSRVDIGPRPAAHLDTLDARVTLGEINLAGAELARLSTLEADVLLSMETDPQFLNDYLRHAPGLSTVAASGSTGHLELSAKVVHGVVQNGARFAYTADAFKVRIPLAAISGVVKITAAVEDGKIAMHLGLRRAKVNTLKGVHLFTAKRLGLQARAPADLTKVNDIDSTFTVEGGRMPQFSVLNAYIPIGSGVRFIEGSGLVNGHLDLDTESHGNGLVDIAGDEVVIQNRSANLKGRVHLEGKINWLDLRTGAMDLSGSQVSIDEVTVRAGGRTYPRFWLHLLSKPCLLTPNRELQWSTTIDLGFSNLQPMLAILSANVPLPKMLVDFADSPNARASADVQVSKDGVELPRLDLRSQSVHVNGVLSLKEAPTRDNRLEPWGNVMARVGPLRVGAEFTGPDVKVVLFDLQKWAEEHKLRLPVTAGFAP